MTSTPSRRSLAPLPVSAEPTTPISSVRARHLVAIAAATAVFVSLLGHVNPFGALIGLFTGGGETMRMQPVDLRPDHIDVLHGEKLLTALRALRPAAPRARLVVFGNSQQYTASLPRGAKVRAHKARMASALLAEWLEAQASGRFAVYNAAAPNQTFPEALWQALYWFEVGSDKPKTLLLQASFDTFRKTGIRPGYQTLLDEPRFVAALERHLAARSRHYATDWLDARKAKADRTAELEGRGKNRQWSPEPILRKKLKIVSLFERRQQLRGAFLRLLYLARVHLLRISPTTRRHITGKPFEQNMAALKDLIELAQRHGARVVLYNAPVNPAIDMFFPAEYRGFLKRLRQLCATHAVPFADLADAVPREHWGYWIDGPDPIHFDAQAHRLVAEVLQRKLGPALIKP